jgi:hypothetical protein
MRMIGNIFWLGTKELRSFLRDYVLLGLVVYAFSLAIIAQAQSSSQELHNASGMLTRTNPNCHGELFMPSCHPIFRRRSRLPSVTSCR